MDQENMTFSLLELVERPAFCVRNNQIAWVNQAARQHFISTGMNVSELLTDKTGAYQKFQGGTLTLSLSVSGVDYAAQVSRIGEFDVFVLESEFPEMRAIALAAQNLREPLNNIMTVADLIDCDNPKYICQLQKGLHSLHRIVCNMSDSYRYQQSGSSHLETTNIPSVFNESMEAIRTHLDRCGIALDYNGLTTAVFGLADREMLERAIYNLVSNAVKFMTAKGMLRAKLTQTGNTLSFTLQANNTQSTDLGIFNRYQREPGVEDGRCGIGLGMPLVRAVAATHGGTVFIDHPDAQTIRITMTISIRKSDETTVRSTIQLPMSNYAGGRDRGLLELSEILPADAYLNNH